MALTDNLVFYTKLDGNANDALGSHNGSATNITFSTPNGKINEGAGASGTGYITFTDDAALKPTGDCSMVAWAKNSTNATFQALFCSSQQNPSFQGFRWLINDGANHQAITYGTGTTVAGTADTHDGNYNFVCFTLTGTTLQFYFNGSTDGSHTITTFAYPGANAVIAGGYNNTGSNIAAYTGAWDEMGMWSRALSGAEITQLYNSGAGLQYPFVTTSIKTFNGLAYASTKTVNGLAVGSVKTWNGLG